MNFFSLINIIRQYCTDNSIDFIYGNDQIVNVIIDQSVLLENELILIADFTLTPTIDSGRVVASRYTGTVSLGQKCEETTESALDETPIEKYDRRLEYLTMKLTQILGELSCVNDFIISSLSIRFDMNKFDLNADFVAGTITIDV